MPNTKAPVQPDWLTITAAAQRLSISRSAMYTLIQRGEVDTVYPLGRARRVTATSLEAFMARRADPGYEPGPG